MKTIRLLGCAFGAAAIFVGHATAATIVQNPFVGVTYITRSEGRGTHETELQPGLGQLT